MGQTWAQTPQPLQARGIGIEVHGEAFPGDALGRVLEFLEVTRSAVHRPIGDGGDQGRIRAGGGAQAAGDALGGVVDRQLGADIAHVPIAAGARRDDGQEVVPGDLPAFQGGFDHVLIKNFLVVGYQVHRLDAAQIILFRQDHRQARGPGLLAEIFRQRRGVDRGGGIQGRRAGSLLGLPAGRLVHPKFQQRDVGLQHLLLFGPQLLFQDLPDALLEFLFRQDAGFLVDQAENGGPGEVPVQVLQGGLSAVQGHELDAPVLDQGLHLGREGGHDLFPTLSSVNHQETVLLQAAHVFPQDLVAQKFLIEKGQHVPLGELRAVADGLGGDAQIHEDRGAFAGGAVAGPGLDELAAGAAFLSVNQGGGLQGGLDAFGAHPDKGHAHFPLGVAGQGRGPQGQGAFDAHVEVPEETALLLVTGQHVLHHRGGVILVEVLASQAIDAVENGGHVVAAVNAVLFFAFPAGPQGDLQARPARPPAAAGCGPCRPAPGR